MAPEQNGVFSKSCPPPTNESKLGLADQEHFWEDLLGSDFFGSIKVEILHFQQSHTQPCCAQVLLLQS